MRLPSSAFGRDVLLAGALTATTQIELLLAAEQLAGRLPVQHAAFAVMTGSVAWRRRAPLAAALGCSAGMGWQTLAGHAPVVGGFLAMLLVAASLGYHAGIRRGGVGLAAIAASAVLYDLLADELVVADLIGNAAIVAMAWGSARTLRVSTERRVAAEVAKDRSVREAVVAERDRIARDLHDSVAHALTVMTLQAGAARERTAEPEVADALRHIAEGGRQALVDMHRFLRLLGDRAGRTEAPGLRDLEDMVERVRSGGLEVDLSVTGNVGSLPASVSSTAYRVVQEGLTNAVKHGEARAVQVRVSVDEEAVFVDVADDGGQVPSRHGPPTGSGRGIAGLSQRVALFGGRLTAAPDPQAGWRLRAVIPVGHQ